jgi:hypothetical protein
MAKKKQGMFSGRTARSMEKPKNAYGYLKIPNDVNVFKPEGGTEVIFDIIPYPVNDAAHMDNRKYEDDAQVGNFWWKRPVKVHKNVGPEEVAIVCPTTIGKKCPICEYGSQRRKAGDEWDDIKDIFPKDRTIFLVSIVDASECEVDYPSGDVYLMDVSYHTFTKYLLEEVDRAIDNDNFPDPYDGMSLKVFFRTKKIGKNPFTEAGKIDFVSREEQYTEEFMGTLPSLDDALVIKNYKEISALYFGMEDLEEDDVDKDEIIDEVEEVPERKKKTTSRKTPRTPEKKEPVAEEEQSEPEPKPTPKPTPRKKKEEEPTRTASTQTCPVKLKFGVDFDQYNECDNCKVWDDCKEAFAATQK